MTDILQADHGRVTLVHMPTGVRASALYGRSEYRNRKKAQSLLRSRLWAQENIERSTEIVRTYMESEVCK